MAQEIRIGIKQLVEDARKEIEEIEADAALGLVEDDSVVIVDLRDVRELKREGKIPGAFHCPRGMLEFWVDPASPYHKPVFAEDKKFVFHCASGWRSALATQIVQKMGLKPVAHIAGGFTAWKKAGGPVEMPE
ncbi:MAG: rhodanese-like domain-containing protein [Hyphomicrobiales bacterium]